jgi:hypothetical protein
VDVVFSHPVSTSSASTTNNWPADFPAAQLQSRSRARRALPASLLLPRPAGLGVLPDDLLLRLRKRRRGGGAKLGGGPGRSRRHLGASLPSSAPGPATTSLRAYRDVILFCLRA